MYLRVIPGGNHKGNDQVAFQTEGLEYGFPFSRQGVNPFRIFPDNSRENPVESSKYQQRKRDHPPELFCRHRDIVADPCYRDLCPDCCPHKPIDGLAATLYEP